MYQQYFGFSEAPFSIAPNPRYLYLSERHREALAHLLYGLGGNGGFILLTGEVGTGKTTVCRCLLEQLPDNTDVAFVLNPRLSVLELLATVCDEFGLDYAGHNPSNKLFVDLLSQFLLDSHAKGRQALLIIDEAQNLGFEVLEELRLLTNLETDTRKLLQILLLGQPELQHMLRENRLRQLNQRVIARYHLQPLSPAELAAYVPHRLRLAGGAQTLIPTKLFPALYRFSGGVPRLINLICDRALLGTYAASLAQVNYVILKRAAQEVLGLEPRLGFSAFTWLKRPAFLWLLVLLLSLALISLLATLSFDTTTTAPVPAPKAPVTQKATPIVPSTPEVQAIPTVPIKPTVQTLAVVPVTPTVQTMPTPSVTSPAKPVESVAHASPAVAASASGISATEAAPKVPAKQWLPNSDQLGIEVNRQLWQDWFSLWGKSWDAKINACDWALSQALVCIKKSGNLSSLLWYNRPALLELRLANAEVFNLLVLKVDAQQRVQVRFADQQLWLDFRQLEPYWLGEYRLLLPQTPITGSLSLGQQGPVVDWLDQNLAQLLRQPPLKTGQFDAALQQRLRQFQRQEGLNADGIIGNQTLMLLAARLPIGPKLLTSVEAH